MVEQTSKPKRIAFNVMFGKANEREIKIFNNKIENNYVAEYYQSGELIKTEVYENKGSLTRAQSLFIDFINEDLIPPSNQQ